MNEIKYLFIVCNILLLTLNGCKPGGGEKKNNFIVVETSIEAIHRAMEAGDISARGLVEKYQKRIAAYDKKGPFINSIITMNDNAISRAKMLDSIYQSSGKAGPLHGIPMIIKDNYDTHDMPTTNGTLALKNSVPPDDAYQVKKIREAGAIIIAKANLAEFAHSGSFTKSSILPGYTRNPYNTRHTTAGSSGGTAAAIAANFAVVGLGTDTGSSIRGPASHQDLVGIRSTMGLTSRDGIIPLALTNDVGGPLARNVKDAVLVFEVIAGYDPADTVTAKSQGKIPEGGYLQSLDTVKLDEISIGVLNQLFKKEESDSSVFGLMQNAIKDFEEMGVTMVDVEIQNLDSIDSAFVDIDQLKRDYNNYLESLGPDAPYESLEEVMATEDFHPFLEPDLKEAMEEVDVPENHPKWDYNMNLRELLRQKVLAVMEENELDALIYPAFTHPPRLIGDLNSPRGANSGILSPPTGFPAVGVPMGFSEPLHLPAGFQLMGKPFNEPVLFKIAYGYEMYTDHRKMPKSTPSL